MSARQLKIIIVGGGPAGIAAALHLAKRAPELIPQMVVLEAKQHPRPKLCGGGITIHGEEQLDDLGITIDVPQFTVHEILFRLGKLEFRVPYKRAMRIIRRADFDAALADAAERAGIRIQQNERLLDIHTHENGATLTTDKGEYEAQIVVAADGANSTVRRKLKFKSTVGVAKLLRVISPLDERSNQLWQAGTAVFDFTCIQHGIQGYMWNFPAVFDGQPVMNSGIFDSRIAPARQSNLAHGTFKNTFADWLGTHDIQLTRDNLEGHPVRWFTPDSEFARPHVLLAGDAAGVDALFAEGISYAMEYGALVTDQICHALETGNYSFGGYRQAILDSHMGRLLMRRAWMASVLYPYRVPPFWNVFWRLANIAPTWMQHIFGGYMALLPKKSTT